MRGLIVIVAIVCLLAACSIDGGRSKWDYYSPEHVQCADTEIEWCRQYGPHLICECVV